MIYLLLNIFLPLAVPSCKVLHNESSPSPPQSSFLSSIMESGHEDLGYASEARVPGKKMEGGKPGSFPLGKEKGGGLSLMW